MTADGFVLKGIDRIIADQQVRAQDHVRRRRRPHLGQRPAQGPGRGRPGSAHELWRGLEPQYYANFVTTAQGPSLDLLGTDLGVARRNLPATGQVTLTLAGAAQGRQYVLPGGGGHPDGRIAHDQFPHHGPGDPDLHPARDDRRCSGGVRRTLG